MKKLGKFLAIALLLLLVLAAGAIAYIKTALPDVGEPETFKISYTPQRIERGRYLSNRVAMCTDCHSEHDWSRFSGPVDTTKLGIGGTKFDAAVGLPGELYSANITPTNLKDWTDGEIFRAITTGVKKDGSAIFPIMPWPAYSKMDREDVYSIIAYIRSLQPQEAEHPERKLDFPLNVLVNTFPEKATLGKRPSESDTVKYGAYLVQIAACVDCHTKDDKGQIIEGLEFAGGREFKAPGILVRSANISPDKVTGIGGWSQAQFVKRFKDYADPKYQPATVGPGEMQTPMPWTMFGKMKDSDLKAMYAYLRTVKPQSNAVVRLEQVADKKSE